MYLNQSNGTIYWNNGSVWAPIAGGGGGGFTLTTNGVRGVATYSAGVLNIPNYSVDTSRIYDSLATLRALSNTKQNFTDSNTWDATRTWVAAQNYATTDTLSSYLLKSDSTIFQPTYRSDTARVNLWPAINSKVNTADSNSVYYSKYRSDTSRLSMWTQINLRQLISDTSTWDVTRTYVQSGTFTMSNKTINTSRWVPGVDSISSSANPSINTDNVSYYEIKAQAANANVTTTGTPVMGQQLCVCWTGTGSHTMTFNTNSFENGAQALPTTITTTKQCAVFLYNTISLRWRFAGSF